MSTTDELTELDVEELSPDDVDLDLVRDGLADDENLVRDRAAAVCLTLADEDVESVTPLLPGLIAAAQDDNVNVVLKAITTLNLIAESRPEELSDAVGPLCAALTHDLPRIQLFAGKTVQTVGAEHPEWFVPHAETLLRVLHAEVTDPTRGAEQLGVVGDPPLQKQLAEVRRGEQFQQHSVQAVAGNLLIEVSEREPTAVASHVAEVTELLDGEDLNIVACAAEILGNLARADVPLGADSVDALVDCLDSESDVVVARSIAALGYLDDPKVAAPIREVADSHDETDLRDLAAETVTWLERDRE